jgi:uncharacterized Fe-S cluster-containing radical SAM superfamily protein
MFNPIELAKQTERIVCRDWRRKYYRFRPAKFYGGIVTADCVGCCLRCIFCWAWNTVSRPEKVGRFYTPKEVVERILKISKKRNLTQVRISGNEPTIGRGHLVRILELLRDSGLTFILETNGILLGYDYEYVKELSDFKDIIHVRVSLKGCNENEFSKLTGAVPEGFKLQLQALRNLVKERVPCHPAVMISFSRPESIQNLRERLEIIDSRFYDFEEEELIFYGNVKERLKSAGIIIS